jgi:hypothetical protein
MTMIIDGTNGLTFNNSTVQASAGQVLQMVNATTSTASTTTSTTFTATALTASITPKFATSKILVLVNGVAFVTLTNYAYYTIAKGTTVLSSGSSGLAAIYNNDGAVPLSMSYLDSPATTSSTSYTVYFKRGAGGIAYFTENVNGTSVITLMEIAA